TSGPAEAAVFKATRLLLTFTVLLKLEMPPPGARVAELPLIVQLVTFTVLLPPLERFSIRMPPVPALELPLIVLLMTFRLLVLPGTCEMLQMPPPPPSLLSLELLLIVQFVTFTVLV